MLMTIVPIYAVEYNIRLIKYPTYVADIAIKKQAQQQEKYMTCVRIKISTYKSCYIDHVKKIA